MANNGKIGGVERTLIVKSVAAAITIDAEKEKKSSIVIAYAVGDLAEDIRFTAIKLPKKNLYRREDILSAICHAENSKDITYVDFDGKDKDIYVCCARTAEAYYFVERDKVRNRFVDGFAEIEAFNLNFETNVTEIKQDISLDIEVTYNIEPALYEKNSVQYAIVNAYNACLLGRAFSRPEFQLETGEEERAKIEIRGVPSRFIDLSTLYIKPEMIEGEKIVSSYITEPINVINGEEMSTKIYRLSYKKSLNDYIIAKAD